MTDGREWNVAGPVRTLRVEHAEWDADRGEWRLPRGISVVTFRPDGQLSESESHNPDGSIARYAHVYDERGRHMETQSWIDNGPRRRVAYSYDAAGRVASAVEISPDGSQREVESYRYDEAGRKTKVHHLEALGPDFAIGIGVEGVMHASPAPGATMSTTIHDDRDLPAEVRFQAANQLLVLRIVFSRDPEGRVLSEVVRIDEETPFPFFTGNAPSIGPPELTAMLANVFVDHTFHSTTYAYDHRGRMSEQIRRFSSLSEERTTFEYDDHDNPVREISRHRHWRMGVKDGAPFKEEEEPRGHETRFEYKYDEHGNWTERIVSGRIDSGSEFRRSNVERRMITYYEPVA